MRGGSREAGERPFARGRRGRRHISLCSGPFGPERAARALTRPCPLHVPPGVDGAAARPPRRSTPISFLVLFFCYLSSSEETRLFFLSPLGHSRRSPDP